MDEDPLDLAMRITAYLRDAGWVSMMDEDNLFIVRPSPDGRVCQVYPTARTWAPPAVAAGRLLDSLRAGGFTVEYQPYRGVAPITGHILVTAAPPD